MVETTSKFKDGDRVRVTALIPLYRELEGAEGYVTGRHLGGVWVAVGYNPAVQRWFEDHELSPLFPKPSLRDQLELARLERDEARDERDRWRERHVKVLSQLLEKAYGMPEEPEQAPDWEQPVLDGKPVADPVKQGDWVEVPNDDEAHPLHGKGPLFVEYVDEHGRPVLRGHGGGWDAARLRVLK